MDCVKSDIKFKKVRLIKMYLNFMFLQIIRIFFLTSIYRFFVKKCRESEN